MTRIAPVVTGACLTIHQLPLVKPLAITAGVAERLAGNAAQGFLKQRDFALLKLQFSDGSNGFGEIAPLPGFSQESLEQAVTQAFQVTSKVISLACEAHVSSAYLLVPELRDCYPSVQFAVEMALASVCRTVRYCSTANSRARSAELPVKTAVLIKPVVNIRPSGGSEGNAEGQPKVALADSEIPVISATKQAGNLNIVNSTTVKVKVAREWNDPQSSGREIDNLRAFAANYPQVTLRLDANQGWTSLQAKEFMSQCRGLPIEFIEEPCNALSDNLELLNQGWPVALDETLQNPSCQPAQFADLASHWAACIIKPTLLGGSQRCQPWVEYCQRSAVRLVVSSSFESPVGLSYLVFLARKWMPDEVHGLDTLSAFTTKSLLPFQMDKGYSGISDLSVRTLDSGKLQWKI